MNKSVVNKRERAQAKKAAVEREITSSLSSHVNLKESRTDQWSNRLSASSFLSVVSNMTEKDEENNTFGNLAETGFASVQNDDNRFSMFNERAEFDQRQSNVKMVNDNKLKKKGSIQSTATTTTAKSNWSKALNKHVHHHQHHAPKEHEKRFSWLDYQQDRKESVVGRGTNIGSKMGYSVSGRPMLITQTEDLGDTVRKNIKI